MNIAGLAIMAVFVYREASRRGFAWLRRDAAVCPRTACGRLLLCSHCGERGLKKIYFFNQETVVTQ